MNIRKEPKLKSEIIGNLPDGEHEFVANEDGATKLIKDIDGIEWIELKQGGYIPFTIIDENII